MSMQMQFSFLDCNFLKFKLQNFLTINLYFLSKNQEIKIKIKSEIKMGNKGQCC